MPNVAATTGDRDGVSNAGRRLLVRVSVAGTGWVRTLPPVPADATVTASVSRQDLALVPADDLVGHGYRLVGVAGAVTTGREFVDLLVDVDLAAAHPAWWEALLGRADRVFDPDHGPVALVLAAVLDLHRAAR